MVSTRDFSATLEIGVTVPIESTSTGIALRSALASSTDTTRARGAAWTTGGLIHDAFVRYAVNATAPSKPAKIHVRFFIISHVNWPEDREPPSILSPDSDLRRLMLKT